MVGDHGEADGDSEYSSLGTAAHALGANCLLTNSDAWEFTGWRVSLDGDVTKDEENLLPDAHVVDKDMADAVQVYLDAVREAHPERDQSNFFVERRFHCPEVHELFYGTADAVYLGAHHLHVWDYKHGVGITVEVENNPQLMYYAVGALTDLGLWDRVEGVVLHVAQPRGFHWAGPVREHVVSVEELQWWRDEVLVPAMDLAWDTLERVRSGELTIEALLEQGYLHSGEHCRFCPTRFGRCPRHDADMEEMEGLMEKIEAAGGAPHATREDLGRFLTLFEIAKIRHKAWREVAHEKAEAGGKIPGWKLVAGKVNRVWKDKVKLGRKTVAIDAAARDKFGAEAFEPEKLKSPAQLEKLPGGNDFSAEYAYKPPAGTQLVPEGDSRLPTGPGKKSMFKPVKQKGKK